MLGARVVSARLVVVTALVAAAPDLDAIGRPFGRGDLALLGGHRAVTHSVFFAALAAAAIALSQRKQAPSRQLRIGLYAAVVVVSHGLLDALSSYGEGVAFFAPFWAYRFKFAWQPFTSILAEVIALWVPAALVFQLWLKRRTRILSDA